jgi:hypothetical protein
MKPLRAGGLCLRCITVFPAYSARTVWGGNSKGELRVLCYQYGGESESGLGPPGSAANWRCIVLRELRKVELLHEPWRTAPNHSRPASCIVDVDIDADDQPERDPQNGQ